MRAFLLTALMILLPAPAMAGNIHVADHAQKERLLFGLSGMPRVLCENAIAAYQDGRQSEENVLLFCENIQNAALQGEESGRVVSNGPETEEAKMAEAVGSATVCGYRMGTLGLYEHNGKHYLIGTAHGFYKDNGDVFCAVDRNGNKTTEGKFYPDQHYANTPGIDPKKSYAFQLPPLNAGTLQKLKVTGLNNGKMNDFVILELKNSSILKNQLGRKRAAIKLARIPKSKMAHFSNYNEVFFMGNRKNYYKYSKTSIEYGCSLREMHAKLGIMKHNCDSGSNSSGAPLLTKIRNSLYSLGVNYAGVVSTAEEFNTKKFYGNYFTPSHHILDVLEKIEGADTTNGAFPPQ